MEHDQLIRIIDKIINLDDTKAKFLQPILREKSYLSGIDLNIMTADGRLEFARELISRHNLPEKDLDTFLKTASNSLPKGLNPPSYVDLKDGSADDYTKASDTYHRKRYSITGNIPALAALFVFLSFPFISSSIPYKKIFNKPTPSLEVVLPATPSIPVLPPVIDVPVEEEKPKPKEDLSTIIVKTEKPPETLSKFEISDQLEDMTKEEKERYIRNMRALRRVVTRYDKKVENLINDYDLKIDKLDGIATLFAENRGLPGTRESPKGAISPIQIMPDGGFAFFWNMIYSKTEIIIDDEGNEKVVPDYQNAIFRKRYKKSIDRICQELETENIIKPKTFNYKGKKLTINTVLVDPEKYGVPEAWAKKQTWENMKEYFNQDFKNNYEAAIHIGLVYLDRITRYFKHPDLNHAAYNSGIGRVIKLRKGTILGDRYKRLAQTDRGGFPVITETKEYIKKINFAKENYNQAKI